MSDSHVEIELHSNRLFESMRIPCNFNPCCNQGALATSCRRTRSSARRWVSAQKPAIEQDVRLRSVCLVVNPTAALLHSQSAPLVFLEQPRAAVPPKHVLCCRLRHNDVTVLVLCVLVL